MPLCQKYYAERKILEQHLAHLLSEMEQCIQIFQVIFKRNVG